MLATRQVRQVCERCIGLNSASINISLDKTPTNCSTIKTTQCSEGISQSGIGRVQILANDDYSDLTINTISKATDTK